MIRGDIKGITGKVKSVKDGMVYFTPHSRQIKHDMKVKASELSKNFEPGSHVTVVYGPNKGEKGLVSAIKDDKAFVVSDFKKKQFEVFTNQLQLSTHVGHMVENNSPYQVYDLISYG